MRRADVFLVAGASAVQVGTATFADPTLADRMVDELPSKLNEVIGTLKSNQG